MPCGSLYRLDSLSRGRLGTLRVVTLSVTWCPLLVPDLIIWNHSWLKDLSQFEVHIFKKFIWIAGENLQSLGANRIGKQNRQSEDCKAPVSVSTMLILEDQSEEWSKNGGSLSINSWAESSLGTGIFLDCPGSEEAGSQIRYLHDVSPFEQGASKALSGLLRIQRIGDPIFWRCPILNGLDCI